MINFFKNLKTIFLGVVLLLSSQSFTFSATEIPPVLEKKMETTISLDLRNMDVVDVYKFLGFKGDFNISISKNVQGRITLFLQKVTVRDALDIVSISNNLGYEFVGDNIIHVMSAEEYSATYGKRFGDKRQVKIVYLNYAKPAYVLEALKNIKSEIGKIVIDEDTGSLVMIDTKEHLDKMQEAVLKLDHPLELKVYTLRYANAEDIANKLKVKLDSKAVGSVQADVRSNRL
ncbi:MAG: secretin N-terminal domain-containing protein, partial [Candidatus Omnitrophica bacterium]|nr:secretin N-terminal domain-containing protein [Candidatus Omnitrophota bacterium]